MWVLFVVHRYSFKSGICLPRKAATVVSVNDNGWSTTSVNDRFSYGYAAKVCIGSEESEVNLT